MFQLTSDEALALRSQIVTLKRREHRKYAPLAFTEQGVAMLPSVLRSARAVQVNIEVVRAFVRLRQVLSTHKDLARRLEELERRYDAQFKVVFDAIRQLMEPPPDPPSTPLDKSSDRSTSLQIAESNCNPPRSERFAV